MKCLLVVAALLCCLLPAVVQEARPLQRTVMSADSPVESATLEHFLKHFLVKTPLDVSARLGATRLRRPWPRSQAARSLSTSPARAGAGAGDARLWC